MKLNENDYKTLKDLVKINKRIISIYANRARKSNINDRKRLLNYLEIQKSLFLSWNPSIETLDEAIEFLCKKIDYKKENLDIIDVNAILDEKELSYIRLAKKLLERKKYKERIIDNQVLNVIKEEHAELLFRSIIKQLENLKKDDRFVLEKFAYHLLMEYPSFERRYIDSDFSLNEPFYKFSKMYSDYAYITFAKEIKEDHEDSVLIDTSQMVNDNYHSEYFGIVGIKYLIEFENLLYGTKDEDTKLKITLYNLVLKSLLITQSSEVIHRFYSIINISSNNPLFDTTRINKIIQDLVIDSNREKSKIQTLSLIP